MVTASKGRWMETRLKVLVYIYVVYVFLCREKLANQTFLIPYVKET